jgi:hypothetical protein
MSLKADEIQADEAGAITRSSILDAIYPIMNETLVAQRLLTIGLDDIRLTEEDGATTPIQNLSHGLAITVAALLPNASIENDSKLRRGRRQWQEQLLRQQNNWPDIGAVTDSTYILCADHKPNEYGLPSQLYTNHQLEGLCTWSDFELILSQLLKTVSPVASPAWVDSKSALHESLVTIIAETFKNTHDHARQEVGGAEVATSVRGLYARFYPLNQIAAYPQTDSVSTPAERYANSFFPQSISKGIRVQTVPSVNGILEISIFDSGPGIAAKWLGKDVAEISPREQYEAVLECFRKGKTSTSGTGRGFGLAKVLSSISALKGLISVRTNCIHVYRQFHTSGEIGWEENLDGSRTPKEQFFDWTKGWSPSPSKFKNSRGTVVSFLIPMGAA